MWTALSHFVIKFRLGLLLALAAITVYMGWQARRVEWSYSFTQAVPSNDPDMLVYKQFKNYFGEDGNVVAIGLKDSALYTPDNFRKFKYLSAEVARIPGISAVLSLPRLKRLVRNEEQKQFELEDIFPYVPATQTELDSMLLVAQNERFYAGQLINEENGATFILISMDKEVLNSQKREVVMADLVRAAELFEQHTGIQMRYAGLPFVRITLSTQVKQEMQLFLVLSIVVTGLILLFFFRSWDAVVFPLLIIGVVVVWVMGSLALFGFPITLLTGLIPPIIVVIGIPNSVYLLSRYHYELKLHDNKILALSRVTRKIGIVTLITNTTTAVGFLVLAFTDIKILKEFGIVAGINIMATFLVSMVMIPGVFSMLPKPHGRQLKHLKFGFVNKVLHLIDVGVHRYKYGIFALSGLLMAAAVIGIFKIKSVSYMVDDIPVQSPIMKDLAFFEANFSGIMPLEILVDTGKKRGVIRQDNLATLERLEAFLAQQEALSRPVSVVSFIKAARQSFYNHNPAFYALPTSRDRNFILRYFQGANDESGLMNAFVDSTGQIMRISLKVADIGSNRLDSLLDQVIRPKMDSLLLGTDLKAQITGATPLFVKGNRFLIDNLKTSLVLAFVIIALIMAVLFASPRMVLLCLLPNLVPLLLTAGIMGYFGIPLKPSTALIFSIVFGISVDDAIHFLAKYRQELYANNFFVPLAVSKSIRETGASMMYTSIVLFAGFVIFSFSQFGGTVALGVLTSITLLIAMFTNLILLPALLLAFDSGKRRQNSHPFIEDYQEFYSEQDDEEIALELVQIKASGKIAEEVYEKTLEELREQRKTEGTE
ncbi:MAG: MMPL family transporter [Cytophagales bacterium]|nr:MMPL family transporter [Cytophagales bacterium]